MAADTVECDVLVVGSGAAGLACALTAAHHGLEVVVAEKAPVYGGTSAMSAGVIWIPCSSHASREGVDDTPARALEYLQNEVGNRLEREQAEAFLAHGPRMLDFLETHTEVRYSLSKAWPDYHPETAGASPGGRSLWVDHFDGRRLGEQFLNLKRPLETTMIMGGMTVAREDIVHFLGMTRSWKSAAYVSRLFVRHAIDRLKYPRGTRIANGNALIARLAMTLFESGQSLWLSSPVIELVQDAGSVTGALVQRKGHAIEVRTRRGVVLASGRLSGRRSTQVTPVRARARRQEPLLAARQLPNTGDGISRGKVRRCDLHGGRCVSRRLDAGVRGTASRR